MTTAAEAVTLIIDLHVPVTDVV